MHPHRGDGSSVTVLPDSDANTMTQLTKRKKNKTEFRSSMQATAVLLFVKTTLKREHEWPDHYLKVCNSLNDPNATYL